MKNIHLLPTEKLTRLFEHYKNLIFGKALAKFKNGRNVYITSDEEIKYNDYITDSYRVWQWKDNSSLFGRKKLILTTDQDLISDGVQAIDDEFLEWFCNNSSCEEVEVFKLPKQQLSSNYYSTINFIDNNAYKIIIPKEEPKQETLEEVKLAILFHNTYEKLAPSFGYETREDTKSFDITTPNGKLMIAVCKEIIKWQQETPIDKGEGEAYRQELFNYLHDNFVVIASESEMQEIERIVLSTQQERMYSEEEVLSLIIRTISKFGGETLYNYISDEEIVKWFNKVKK